MPIWHVLHSDNILNDPREKAALAKTITSLYTDSGLPAFYVNTFFHKFAPGDAWRGTEFQGEIEGLKEGDIESVKAAEKPFVHFEIDQIAVHITSEEWARKWCEKLDAALKPHIADKGYEWEYHIDETPRSLWRIEGFVPPPWKSAVERKWFVENKATPWQEEEANANSELKQ